MICFVIEPHGVQERACSVFIQIACCCYVSQHVLDCNCMPDWDTFLQREVSGGILEGAKIVRNLTLVSLSPSHASNITLLLWCDGYPDISISILPVSPTKLSSLDQRHDMSFILQLWLQRQNSDGNLGGQAFLLLTPNPYIHISDRKSQFLLALLFFVEVESNLPCDLCCVSKMKG